MRKNLLITPMAMVLVAGAMSLSAQDFTSGTLAGRVTGPNGQPLQGVTVILNSPSLLAPRQFTTDATGQFRAQMLMGGNYTITYTLSGYLTRRLTTYVTPGQTIRGDMQLRPIDVQAETVEIVATTSQQVDKTDTVVQSSLSQQKLIELTGGASIGGLLSVIPGVVQDGSQYKIRGSTSAGTKIAVDGGNITNMAEGTGYAVRFPLADAIESIAVIQSPLNARYGNSDGGLVSFVLNKGSNEFKGSARVSLDRTGIWNVFNPYGYPNNRGVRSTNTVGSDDLGKSYQFYLSGPLWKDHITFSWSSRDYPTYRWMAYQYESTGGIWVSGNGSAIDPSRYRVGTYFKAPNGEVIRKAEMLEATDPMNTIPRKQVSGDSTYTLFYQVTQNHQVEWSYSENIGNNYNPTNYNMADMNANPIFNDTGYGLQRKWNIAYRGIIGMNGLLDARMSRSTQSWFNVQVDGRPKHSVSLLTLPSYTPFSGLNDNNPNNYYASGLIDALLNRNDGIKDSRLGGTTTYNFNANNEGPGDTATNEPININYQHILQTPRGQHIIDVGFQREKSAWVNPNLYGAGSVNAERLIYSPGRIALDLQPSDIFNYTGTPLDQYRGKFIAFNMNHATFNSIDPYGFSRFNTGSYVNEPIDGNMRLIDHNSGAGWGQSIWPRMFEQYGGMYTDVYVQQTSLYLNDLWSINDHHSIMGGLRYDMYKVWDSKKAGDIYSYNMPTLRFDYKFDIHGDQKRIVNVSWGQFHNMAAVSAWAPFLDRGIREMIWDKGPADGSPYLVDFADIMNKDNYRQVADNLSGGVNEVADGYKGLVTTEFTLGIRLNLDNGGSLRAAYIKRSIANDYAYFYNGWRPNPSGSGPMVISRLLDNLNEVERSYNSFELEWTIPVTKRVDFGGSYSFARQMENGTDETNNPQKSANKSIYWWREYNEQYDFPYWGYNPVRLRSPEQRFNAYINYNLTAGKVKSNVAFRFAYTTASPATRSLGYEMGFPVVDGLYISKSGERDYSLGQPTNLPSNTGSSSTRTVFYNIHRTGGPDGWSTNLTYNLEVPVTHKLLWFATITSGNPFNHRAKSTGWYSIDGWVGSGNLVPETILNANGSVWRQANNPYAAGGMKSDNVQRSNANLFAPNQVTGGRSIGLQTGLRF
jgi:hypothetical protein